MDAVTVRFGLPLRALTIFDIHPPSCNLKAYRLQVNRQTQKPRSESSATFLDAVIRKLYRRGNSKDNRENKNEL
jgi:hypothetical protein